MRPQIEMPGGAVLEVQNLVAHLMDLRANLYHAVQPICEPGHLDQLSHVAPQVKGMWVADLSCCHPEDRGNSERIGSCRNLVRMAAT